MKKKPLDSLTQTGLAMLVSIVLSLALSLEGPWTEDVAFTSTFPLATMASVCFMLAALLAIIVVVQAAFCVRRQELGPKRRLLLFGAILWLAFFGWLLWQTAPGR